MSYTIRPQSAQFLMGISDVNQFEEWLAKNQDAIGVSFVGRSNVGKTILVFNKIDKLKTQKERNVLEKLKPILSKDYKWIRQMYFASAHSKKGIPQIEEAIITHFLEELEMRKTHVVDPNLDP